MGLMPLCGLYSCGSETTEPRSLAQIGAALPADAGSADIVIVDLNGAQVLPAVDTRHTGRGEFSVDQQTGQLFGTVTTSVDLVQSVQVDEGRVGEAGSVVTELVAAGDSTFIVPANTLLNASQLQQYAAGNLYVDLHAADVELRGQLSLEPPAVTVASELEDLQTKVLTPICSGCHTGTGSSLPSVMNLSTSDASYLNLVGVYSIGENDLLRVDPSNVDESLLIRKLEGTQTVGARMPFRGAMLEPETIAAFRQWFANGAPR